ncbi:MAG: glycosyltransferase family A protein [Rhodobacter sp.]|nr:glycosyltransferase family A protein [Rhodobacter sp.]
MPNDATAPRLTVAISSLGARAGQIALPPPEADITYLLLLQRPQDAPPLAPRADLTVVPLDSLGTAASRNAALDAAKTPFLLFADDDVALDIGGVKRLLDRLAAAPGLDIVTARLAGTAKRYAPRAHRLRRWNAGKTGTPEILVRLARIRARGVRFDADFGIGGRYGLGEEFVFLADALAAGLRGRFEPVTIGRHPGAGTGGDWADPALLRARIAVLARVFGRAAPLARLAYALKHRRRLAAAPGGAVGFLLGRRPS